MGLVNPKGHIIGERIYSPGNYKAVGAMQPEKLEPECKFV